MKGILSYLLMLLVAGINAQQPFNKAFNNIFEPPKPFLLEAYGDYYFVTGNNFVDFTFYLHKVGKNGSSVFRKQVYTGTHSPFVKRVFKTLDNKIAILGWTNGCDYSDTAARSFFYKVDTSGQVLFLSKLKTSNSLFTGLNPSGFSKGIQHADSSFFLFADSVIYHYSKNGGFLSKSVGAGLTAVGGLIRLSNGNILASAVRNGSPKFLEIDAGGNIVSTLPAPVLFSKLEYYGPQKIMGYNGEFYKFSPAFDLIGASNSNVAVMDFIVRNDTVYYVGSAAGSQVYRRVDTSFNLISTSSSVTDRLQQYALCKVNENIAVLSQAFSAATFSANNSIASLNVFPKSQSNNFNMDAAMTAFDADSLTVSYWLSGGFVGYNTCLKASVWIKNKGNSNISSLRLNCHNPQPTNCGQWYFQKYFSGFNLLPGDSIHFNINPVCKTDLRIGPLTQTVSIPYCIYVTVPDSSNDKEISNDGICKNFVFYPVGLNEHGFMDEFVKIFPNPSAGIFEISSSSVIRRIEVLDLTGTRIMSREVNSVNVEIDLKASERGLYFVRMSSASGQSVTRKIMMK